MFSRRCFFFIGVLILLSSVCALAQKSEQDAAAYSVEGTAKIRKGDLARAREEAIRDALEKAVIEAVSKMPGFSLSQEDFKLVRNIFAQKADQYVMFYTIAEESRDDQEFRLRANVFVSGAAMRKDLGKMGFLEKSAFGQSETKAVLVMQGIDSYASYQKIKAFLQGARQSIKSVYPLDFTWRQARFVILVPGDIRSITEELFHIADCSIKSEPFDQKAAEIICRYTGG